jgi:hypothetical protein
MVSFVELGTPRATSNISTFTGPIVSSPLTTSVGKSPTVVASDEGRDDTADLPSRATVPAT